MALSSRRTLLLSATNCASPGELAIHQGLAQFVALTLAQTLDPEASAIALKWPNDLFLKGKKLGGILVDLLPHNDQTSAVIGIGINRTRQSDCPENIAFYHDHFHDVLDLARITPDLLTALKEWQERPYLPAAHRWSEYDQNYGKLAQLEGQPEAMRLFGIDQKGRLIATHNQQLHYLTTTRITHVFTD